MKNGKDVKLTTEIEKQGWLRLAAHAMEIADGDTESEITEEAAAMADKMMLRYRERVG